MRFAALIGGIVAVVSSLLLTPTTAEATEDFRPASTSWLSSRHGYVLGSAPCDDGNSCARLLTTSDGGRSWQQRKAPKVGIDNGNAPTVTAVDDQTLFIDRFVDHDGTLAMSTDDARSWQSVEIAVPKGQQILGVNRIAVHHDVVYAVINTVAADGGGKNQTAVYTMAIDEHRLSPHRMLSITGAMPYGDVSSRGGVLQVVLGSYGEGAHYWYSFFGRTFRSAPAPCGADQYPVLDGIAGTQPVAGCTGPSGTPQPGHAPKQLARADRLSDTFATVGEPAPTAGAASGFAQPTRADATFAATGGGLVLLYGTRDGGNHWETTFSKPGFAAADLQFTSATDGTFVKLGDGPSRNELYRSTDAGITWHEINITG